MKRVYACCPLVILTLACARASQSVNPPRMATGIPHDSSAAALAEQLTRWGFTTTQEDSGGVRIVKGSLRLAHGSKLAGHPFGYWADCGKLFGLSRASTADEMQVEVLAIVRPEDVQFHNDDPIRSHASAKASFTAYDRQALGDPASGCGSRGLLEQALLNAGYAKDTTPFRVVQPDGPYALSPRPGDSLSFPMADDPRLANPASLEACAWDSLEQPYLDAKGEVTYAVTAAGLPDTATLTVQSLVGVDTRTFQAVARRLVANCRFRARVVATDETPGLIRQRLFFSAWDAASYKSANDLFVSHDAPADSALASQMTDATIISCPLPEGLPPGRVELQFVVGLDGKPEPGTIRAVNATSAELARAAPGIVKECRFTTARFKGRPVRSLIRLPIRVGLE